MKNTKCRCKACDLAIDDLKSKDIICLVDAKHYSPGKARSCAKFVPSPVQPKKYFNRFTGKMAAVKDWVGRGILQFGPKTQEQLQRIKDKDMNSKEGLE